MKRTLILAAALVTLSSAPTSSAASMSTLHHRQARQVHTISGDVGTLRFFRHYRRLAHTPAGRKAIRFARAELRWTRRELAQTLAERRAKERAAEARRLAAMDPASIVCMVFGPYCAEALRVSRDCEARRAWIEGDPTKAANGQYLGPFQMGTHERATYGDGRTMLTMTQAAYRYFVASGRDWSPWSCKP